MSMFDQDSTTYTQEGRIIQLEYANKAIETAETIVGLKCQDGVVLGAEKLVFSKLLVEGTNRRLYNIDKHIGMAIAGKIPDGRHLMNYARSETLKYLKDFDVPITGKTLSDRLALYLNAHTLANSVRPFGSSEIIASWNEYDGYKLHMLELTGNYYGYTACTAGKGRQVVKAEIQKLDFSKLTCKQALFYAAKMLCKTNEESRDKKYEIELSWVCEESNHIHQTVPVALRDDAVKRANAAIQEQEMG